ncbi:protein Sur7p [[Candida] anglica]|uniref:Protein Sur7p n=1 Tax=[Candida] anglica TaxID=148631 RepID=A0ABP0EAA2_9ASCO
MTNTQRLTILGPTFLVLVSFCFLLIVNLNGTRGLPQLYWSEVETITIRGAIYETTRWTSYGICGVDFNGGNVNCTTKVIAFPYSPYYSFLDKSTLPSEIFKNRDLYSSLSKAAFGLFLSGLILVFVTLILLVCFCFILESSSILILGVINNLISFIIVTTATILISVPHFMGVHAFENYSRYRIPAHIGAKLFGITFAAVATLLLALVWHIWAFLIIRRYRSFIHQNNQNGFDDRLYSPDENTSWDQMYSQTARNNSSSTKKYSTVRTESIADEITTDRYTIEPKCKEVYVPEPRAETKDHNTSEEKL